MARGRHPRGFTRPAPKTKIWIGADTAVGNLTSNAKTLIAELNAAALALRPFTVLRTRVEWNFRSDQVVANESPTGSIGMIVAKEIAVNIGVTAVPGPIAEVDADWFVYQGVTSPLRFVSATGIVDPAGTKYTIDSKAMRKVGPADDIVWVAELRNAGGAVLNMEGRMLIQLH